MNIVNNECGCKWHFGPGGKGNHGKSNLRESFSQPYYSIVRESIQNSLDAAVDDTTPVIVSYDFVTIKRTNFPELFAIEDHLVKCKEFSSFDSGTEEWVDSMLNYIRRDDNIICFKISDYNTTGMSYDKNDLSSTFTNFVENVGFSTGKGIVGGGSFGFGKGAYFKLSPISTLLVSSMDVNGRCVFQGVAKLTTHYDKEGNKLSDTGYYDNNDSDPATDYSHIPEMFHRFEPGTDIFVVGYDSSEDYQDQMIKSILNNFWLAILRGKLIVKVFGQEIKASNLYSTAKKYYSDELETEEISDFKSWNPIPYMKAVRNAGTPDAKYRDFTGHGDILGDMRLFIYRNKDLPNRIAFFRKPYMTVQKKTKNKLSGYVGVFVCDNEQGNQILRKLENQEHNVWNADKENVSPAFRSTATAALREISNFINEKLSELSSGSIKHKSFFVGLEQYLATPEDLIDNEAQEDIPGETSTYSKGDTSSLFSEDETGAITSSIISSEKRILIQKGTYIPSTTATALTETESDDLFVNGKIGISDSEDITDFPGSGGPLNLGQESENGQKARKLIKVRYAVAVSRGEKGNLTHSFIIDSPEDISNANLEIFDNTDNGETIESDISSCFVSKRIEGNKIYGIKLNKGRNVVPVGFSDNIKHCLKLMTYEIE